MGELPTALPFLSLPDVPFALETLSIVAPYAITLAMIGLLESLLTAQLIDDITDTRSDKDRESRGQGIANVATGFLGGMAGCAMIGQSMINVKSGGRSRLSTLSAGVLLATVFFARRVAHLVDVTSVLDPDGTERVYHLTGELFFASTNELVHSFEYREDVERVVIDLTEAHVWDSSAVATLDAVVYKFEARGIDVELVGLNDDSHALHNGLTGRLAGGH